MFFNPINYYDWKRNYNNMICYLPDLMNYLKYGDEKMDIEKIKEEINDIKDIDSLDDLLNEITVKIEKYYEEREEKINHKKFVVDKSLKEKLFIGNFSSEIDNIDFRILIKSFDTTINDIAEIIKLLKSVGYEIKTSKINSDGLLLIFIEE